MSRDNYWEVTLSHTLGFLVVSFSKTVDLNLLPTAWEQRNLSGKKERKNRTWQKRRKRRRKKKSWKPSRQKCTILSLGQSSRGWLLCFSFKVRACYWFAYSRPRNRTVCFIWFAGSLSRLCCTVCRWRRERLNSMAGTSFSLPGCENIDLILAATEMGECICISKMCLALLLGAWLCTGLPGFMYILAHIHNGAHI